MKNIQRKSLIYLPLFVVTGAVLGGIISEILASSAYFSFAAYFDKRYVILNIAPFTVNLSVIEFTIGLRLNPNLFSVLGALAGVFLFKRV